MRYSVHRRSVTRDRTPTLQMIPQDVWPEDEVTDVDVPVDVLDRPPLARVQTLPRVLHPTTPVLRVS